MHPTLPELPEGYFWRIKSGGLGNMVYISLRKRHKFWFSTSIDHYYFWPDQYESLDEGIVDVAHCILDERSDAAVLKWALEQRRGDYPPKEWT